MFTFVKKKEQYVECFFCDLKPTKEQSFKFQYIAEGQTYSVDICPICAGTLEGMIEMRDELKKEVDDGI